MSAAITIDITGGTSIERACEDAHRVANALFIDVRFHFNGVDCLARPQGSAQLLAERQQAEQARKLMGQYDHRFACSDPRWTPRRAALAPEGDAR